MMEFAVRMYTSAGVTMPESAKQDFAQYKDSQRLPETNCPDMNNGR
jgi:hypothetical protein